jgi:hypothetical protein
LDLLATYTHDSELQAITAPPLITTALAKPFPACCVFTCRSLVKVSNSGDYSASARKSSLNGGFLPTVPFLHSLLYRTNSVAPVVFLITPLHGANIEHSFQHYSIIACVSATAGTCLPSRCLDTALVYLLISRSLHTNSSTLYDINNYWNTRLSTTRRAGGRL